MVDGSPRTAAERKQSVKAEIQASSEYVSGKLPVPRGGRVVQSVMGLLHKHHDLSSDLQHLQKSCAWWHVSRTSVLKGQKWVDP